MSSGSGSEEDEEDFPLEEKKFERKNRGEQRLARVARPAGRLALVFFVLFPRVHGGSQDA